MRHTGIRAVGFISVLLLLPVLSACDDKTPAPAQTESSSYVIDSAVVKAADVPLSFSLNGRVVAYARADVRPQADGLIKERLFTEGSWVEQGQSLYQIDDALYQAQYAYAKANLAKARDEAAQAKREFERYQGLFKQDAVSAQEYEDKRLSYLLSVDEEQLAQATLMERSTQLAYTQVRAPISGTIGKSQVTPGALVTANQSEVLATIIDLTKVYVDVQQSGTRWRALRQGIIAGNLYGKDEAEAVELYFDDGTRYPILGQYALTEVEVDESSGSVTLRAQFDNPERLLLPGMAVRLHFKGPTLPQAVVVPASAVGQNAAGNSFVFIVEDDLKVRRQFVQADFLVDDGWVISQGLRPGQRVALNGLQKLKTGMSVALGQDDVK
ncbi:MAG: efflux RND transporter periplasmic adaptor subunit [Candidatus Anaerobiospirillum merdipullorum]|uniref:Efflux RND transporter periplasmic adaptor subunit n=1 Tax=Candidatus Anaerobiospirillum merdipullorum TaxID=2838450 RepID=A0A9E2KNE4_9GAMM|nr:efflux RND transporter periplasmic adaptor subunit [Candidatus Anaerobiospirillum merdipullorum]